MPETVSSLFSSSILFNTEIHKEVKLTPQDMVLGRSNLENNIRSRPEVYLMHGER